MLIGSRYVLLSSLLCGATAFCQTSAPLAPTPQPMFIVAASPAFPITFVMGDEARDHEATAAAVTVSAPAPTTQPLTHRWLDLQTLAHGQRYRSAAHSGGGHFIENAQQRTWAVGHLKLDANDRYAIGFRASSGHYFNWAYADIYGNSFTKLILNKKMILATYTPAEYVERTTAALVDPVHKAIVRELQSAGWQMYPRELYFRATPVDAVSVEAGSLGIERGYSTETRRSTTMGTSRGTHTLSRSEASLLRPDRIHERVFRVSGNAELSWIARTI